MKNRIIFLLTIAISSTALSQKVTAVDGKKIELRLDGAHLSVNKKYFLVSPDKKRKGIIQINDTDEIDTAHGTLLKGFAETGWLVQDPTKLKKTNESTTKKKQVDQHSNHGLSAFIITGNATSTGAVSDGLGGSVSYSANSNLSGFSLGYEYNMWLSDISIGADFRYESVSAKSDGGSSSNTLYKFGITGGFLLSDLNTKLNAGYYLFGAASSGVSTVSGLRLGAQYYFTQNFAGLIEIQMLNSTSSSSAEGSTQASAMSLKMYNFGIGYYF